VNIQYKCNNKIKDEKGQEKNCSGLEKFDVNLLEILPTKDENHNKQIMISENLGIVMKYPTFEMISNLKNEDENEILMELLILCIDYIFDKDNLYYAKDVTKEELTDFIDNLQQKDLEKIQLFFETSPKIKKSLHFGCKKCGYEEDIVVEGLQNFFI
jgi:hypothetical protein